VKIVSVYFDYNNMDNYKRLAEVWEYSARKHNPGATVELIKGEAPKKRDRQKDSWIYNDYKLIKWVEVATSTEEPLILMDADMLVIGDMTDVFELDFDICYTERTKSNFPLNGGVLFIRPTAKAKKFMQEWLELDKRMLKSHSMYFQYRVKYGGMNQASFGFMIEQRKKIARIATVPCTKYNLCDEEWRGIEDDTRAIHIKGLLRRVCLGAKRPVNKQAFLQFEKCLQLWKQYEAEFLNFKET